MSQVRCIRADNPSPMTLDGTRTYLVGDAEVAIIDPGPDLPEHINAVVAAAGDRVRASVLITHAHPDHDGAGGLVAGRLGVELRKAVDGDAIPTDAGELVALATPGHTADHMSFWLATERAVFCGDLMMGGLDTALVAPPEGNLCAYLASLQRIRKLDPAVIYPAHGPDIENPREAIDRYVRHREERVAQVVDALKSGPRGAATLVDSIYGQQLDERLRYYAESAVEAYLEYLASQGAAHRVNEEWSLL